MASYQVKVDLNFVEKGIVRGALLYYMIAKKSIAQLVNELARYVDGMDPFRIKYFTMMAYEDFAECQGELIPLRRLAGLRSPFGIWLAKR